MIFVNEMYLYVSIVEYFESMVHTMYDELQVKQFLIFFRYLINIEKKRQTFIFQCSNFSWSTTKSSFIGYNNNDDCIFSIGFEHCCMIFLIGTRIDTSIITEKFIAR